MIHSQHTSPPADPAATGLEPAGDGKMWFDGRFRSALGQARLDSFEQVMASVSGRCLRTLPDRENWYLKLSPPHGRSPGVYLKKHHVRTWQSRLRAKCGAVFGLIGPGDTAGRREAQNVGALEAEGLKVMDLVAYGEKLHGDGRLESFVLTEELTEYTELHKFLRRRFPTHPTRRGPARDGDLDRLIRQVAEIVRRFHEAGFNHRDLYCCHFFVKEPGSPGDPVSPEAPVSPKAPASPGDRAGRFEIRLIDLQRVQLRRHFRRRWMVKDLAQLAWSVPLDCITCTQKLAFMRHYLGRAGGRAGKLRPDDKRLIRAVLAKQHVMQRKLGTA